MAGYAQNATRSTRTLPRDLPDPAGEQGKGVPEGAVFVSDEMHPTAGKPRRFKLVHKREASWEETFEKQRKPAEAKPQQPATQPQRR